ncbi:MAG: sulfite exporter TauE/SafE family protein [Lewinellaceae bacterium]|nr:sulfite exporter TauE/SafE family protein [Saprospiraceae bacterium]MCB0542738.1 sulfite exporter TauE/SafE family protein [Saprospiraceae bacterium]MCB9306674.1 sulfite exporter TauE/SafE family protein [Lewinellaceae bacterium]MCB9353021.1 sulfite exporter TauE/SafE family protein [Lewinellaceae bacterium]
MILLPPLLLGIAGSLHCVGMCGPLLMALPWGAESNRKSMQQVAIYHGGRILSYAALGLLFGLAGKGLAMAGFQKSLSLVAGVSMIAVAVASWRFEKYVTALPGFAAYTRFLQVRIGELLRKNPRGMRFSIGMFNGLLPCGMVYAALAGAVSTAGAIEGSAFMALFGLGTLPLLFSVHLLGRSLSVPVRQKFKILQPILLTAVGLLLIQRGLQLDLSLFEAAVPRAGFECH